jgi:adenylate cyclase
MAETRKLAAILAVGVVGRLTRARRGSDPGGAQGARSDLIDPTTTIDHGRVVKRAGDGTSVEFRSVVDAVRCAVEALNGAVSPSTGLR